MRPGGVDRWMTPLALRIGFVLLTLAHLDWARLALTGGLPLFGAALLVEALAFAALAWRPALARPAALVAIACEITGILILGFVGLSLAYNLVIVAGLALVAWRASFAPGAYVAVAGYGLYGANAVANGETFLLLGLVLAFAGWAIVSWTAFAARQPSVATSADAHAGARP